MEDFTMTIRNIKQSTVFTALLLLGITTANVQATTANVQATTANVQSTSKTNKKWTKKQVAATLIAGATLVGYAGYIGYNLYNGRPQDKFTKGILAVGNAGLSMSKEPLIRLGRGMVDAGFSLVSMALVKSVYETLKRNLIVKRNLEEDEDSTEETITEKNTHQA